MNNAGCLKKRFFFSNVPKTVKTFLTLAKPLNFELLQIIVEILKLQNPLKF